MLQPFYLRSIVFVILSFVVVSLAEADEYKIGIGDVLRITVYDNQDLDTTARVGGDGTIQVSLLGSIKAVGLSVGQLAKKIEKNFANGYLVNPQVTVFMEEFKSSKVTILGKVQQPGLYELSGNISLLELISRAGGLADDAGSSATIKKKGKKEPVASIDLELLVERGDLSKNILIEDGDTIFISKAGTCYVTGEVEHPDSYPIEKGATVLKMITKAGGFTGIAAQKSVKIIRIVNGKKKIYDGIDLSTKVMNDDIILVPESFF